MFIPGTTSYKTGDIFGYVQWSLKMYFVFYIFGIVTSIRVTLVTIFTNNNTNQSVVWSRRWALCVNIFCPWVRHLTGEVILYRFNALQNPPKQTLLPNSSPGKPSVSLEKRCRHATPSFMTLRSTFSAVIFSTSTKAFAPSLNSGFFAAILEHLFWETGSIDTGEAKKNPANLSQRVYWLSVPRANGRYPAKHDACQQKNPASRSWRGTNYEKMNSALIDSMTRQMFKKNSSNRSWRGSYPI